MMRPWLLLLRCSTQALMAMKAPFRLVFSGLGILQMAGDDEHLRAVAGEHPCHALTECPCCHQ